MLPFLMGSAMTTAAPAAASSASWMPMLGGFMGGMGQFAGGVSGLFGGSDHIDQSPANKAWKRQKKIMKNQLMWRVKDAKRAGLHPLAALGISPSSGPSMGPSVGSRRSTGRSLANMGQGLRQMLAGKSELDMAMAAYYRAMAAKAMRPAISGQPQSQVVVDSKGVVETGKTYEPVLAQKNVQSTQGYEGGKAGFFQFANIPDGGVQVYPTQLFQESTSEGFHALEYGINMAGKWAKGISTNNLNTKAGMVARNELRNQQRAVEKEYGGRYAYNPFSRAWYPTNTNQLFNINSKILNRYTRNYEYGTKVLQKSHRTPLFDRSRIQNESWYFD